MKRAREMSNRTEETVALLSYLEGRGLSEEQAVGVMEFAIRALTRGELTDPHERECASAAIAARIDKAKGKERREWIAFRKETLGH